MNVSPLGIGAAPLDSPIPAQRCPVSSGQLLTACRLAWEHGGQLVTLWGRDERDRGRGLCVRVSGDGVHEIAVGPVHAGIIEPGHFRFQVVGEKVLRLEERLGYVHKGIEKRFETFSLAEGYRLAGRVSGDSTVAYAWAYAQAAEAIAGITVPPRAASLRALCLERERIANHLGDLGYLGNDGGFAFGLAQFSRLKEQVLRLNRDVFGHRLLMDMVIPGGVAHDIEAAALAAKRRQCIEARQ